MQSKKSALYGMRKRAALECLTETWTGISGLDDSERVYEVLAPYTLDVAEKAGSIDCVTVTTTLQRDWENLS